MPTQQEIMASQGTRLSSKAPWETYNLQENLNPALEREIEEYSKRRHESTSSEVKEELHRQKEINNEIAKQYRWVTPEEYADEGPRIGKIRHSSDIINILRNKCNVKCWYREHPQPRKVTLMVQRKPALEPEVGCWSMLGWMPEYTIMRFDDHGVPLDEKYRGWRTVCLQLILKQIVTESQVNENFGYAHGPVSERYLSMLYGFRNHYIEAK